MLTPARLAKSGTKTDKQRGGDTPGGFTIIEVLIVLAVTGFMTVSALILVSGRQNKVEFQTAVNSLQQQMQQIINETQSGYFPSSDSVSCRSTSGNPPVITAGSSSQGTNSGCVFIGKALRFGTGGSGLQPDEFTVYPLAGSQQNSSGQDVTTPVEANATPIAPDSVEATDPTFPDLSSVNLMKNGLSFQWATYDGVKQPTAAAGHGAPDTTVFAVVTSFASYSGAGVNTLNSGNQVYALYGFAAPASFAPLTSSPRVVDAIKSKGLNSTPFKTVGLCFASGTTGQSALITIGSASGGGLGVTTQTKNSADCS